MKLKNIQRDTACNVTFPLNRAVSFRQKTRKMSSLLSRKVRTAVTNGLVRVDDYKDTDPAAVLDLIFMLWIEAAIDAERSSLIVSFTKKMLVSLTISLLLSL